MLSALVVELVLSAGFLLVIHGATDKFAPAGFAPIAIGLALTLIHLISIPVTNTSVNPARSAVVFPGRLGIRTTVVLLGGANCRRHYRWSDLPDPAGKA